jgi:hypothetical protein
MKRIKEIVTNLNGWSYDEIMMKTINPEKTDSFTRVKNEKKKIISKKTRSK